MKGVFVGVTAAVISFDLLFTRRWERIIRKQAAQTALLGAELEGWRSSLADYHSRLQEREEIAAAMFGALADARSALVATIDQASCGDEEVGE